jgi:hypothetical protein
MPEDNEKDNGSKAANRLKDRPDKKPDLHDYKSEDKDVIGEASKEEAGQLQDEHESETHKDESLPAGA